MAQGSNNLQGLSVSRRWQDLRIPTLGNVTEHSEEPSFRQNEKRLPGGRSRNTTKYYGEGPGSTYDDSQEYLQKVAAGLMPQMNNHHMMKELAERMTTRSSS